MRNEVPSLFILATLMLVSVGLAALGPKLIASALDGVSNISDLRSSNFVWTVVGYIVICIVLPIITLLVAREATKLSWRITNRLRSDLVKALMSNLSSLENIGERLDRIEGDSSKMAGFFSVYVVTFVTSVVMIAVTLLVMAMTNLNIAMSMFFMVLVAIFILYRLRNISSEEFSVFRNKSGLYMGAAEEAFSFRRSWYAINVWGYISKRMEGFLYEMKLSGLLAYRKSRLIWPVALIVFGISHGMTLGLALYLVMIGQGSWGLVLLAFQYIENLRRPIESLASQSIEFNEIMASFSRIRKTLYSTEDKIRRNTSGDVMGSIRFVGVSKIYADGTVGIYDINMDFKKGELVVLMGRTGSGKSTFCRLAAGIDSPTSGSISYGGEDSVSDLDCAKILFVSQNIAIFNTSVRENFSIFLDATDEQMIWALRYVGLGAWIDNFENGLDQQLSNSSSCITPGQAALFSLARVLLSDFDILIWDEPSALLDINSENILNSILSVNFEGKLRIIASHRSSIVDIADRLVNFEHGVIKNKKN